MADETTAASQGFTSLEVAEALAPTWHSRREQIEAVCTPLRELMVRELDPQTGDTVLELAAGTGETGFDAAERLGEGGRLISSDFSQGMLDGARRRGEERGIENAEYRVIDAERIELEDDSVDGAICRFGYMLMEDPAAALSETRRVLRPGGRLVLSVWGPPDRNPFFMIPAMSLLQRGHLPPPEPPPAPGLFAMADPERTAGLLRDAGFEEARTEEFTLTFPPPSAEAFVEFMADTAGPIAMALRGLSEADRAEVASDVDESLTPFAADGGYQVPSLALVTVAR
jgi:SAM-dependent methyltransferase